MRTWRNWQTRKIQVLMVARLCRFKSCCPHQSKQKRTEIIRFVFSYLWFATGLVTMQGIVCTLRVPLHAADAPLGNNIALLALLRSFYSLQVLLSAPKKTIRKGCLFSCGSGLETKLRFVGKRHCVCLPLHVADMADEGMYRLKD